MSKGVARRRAVDSTRTVDVVGVAKRYRMELIALAAIVLAVGFLLAWPGLSGSETAPSGTISTAPVAGGRLAAPTMVPVTQAPATGPSAVPTYQPAQLTEQQAIEIIASRPVNGVQFTSLRQISDKWSAEYRGDGTWLVRGGDASWLVFEHSRGAMPANQQAMNYEAPGRRTVK